MKKQSRSGSKKTGWLIFAIGLLLANWFFPGNIAIAQITLAWDTNQESDSAGYNLYCNTGEPDDLYNGTEQGASPGVISLNELQDPQNPSFLLSGLKKNTTYFFVIWACDLYAAERGYA